MRTPLAQVSPQLIEHCRHIGFTPKGVAELLGAEAYAALFRGEPGAVLHRLQAVLLEQPRDHSGQESLATRQRLAGAIEFLLVHRPKDTAGLDAIFGADLADALIRTGFVGPVGSQPGPIGETLAEDSASLSAWVPMYDLRSHEIGGDTFWVISDQDASMIEGHVPGSEHVLGVGAASLSLLSVTPRTPVHTVLDLGTGSGVQVLGQLGLADQITATDFYPRALDLAEATLAPYHNFPLRGSDSFAADADGRTTVSLLEGSWFEPVAGMRFDRIISNPPFVVGSGTVFHGYRDSGLDLDGATELVVREAVDHLTDGGQAHILGAWVHQEGHDWRQRLSSWLPDDGVAAWILQRDVADPNLYVGTWLRDESIDPRSAEGIARTQGWLQHFEDNQVTGIGFGYIHLERIDEGEPSDVLIEELHHEVDDYLGDEVSEYFTRARWLRDQTPESIVAESYQLRPGVALEDVLITDQETAMGFSPAVLRLTRTDGTRFSHEIDSHLRAIISGLHPHGLCLGEVAELYAYSQDVDSAALSEALVGPVVDLVRHGILVPASLIDD